MIRIAALVTVMVLARAGQASAQPPAPEEIAKPHMVVLASSPDQEVARRAANRAADLLGCPVAPDTLQKPPARRIYVGAVVTLQRSRGGGFDVVSYLGDEPDARKAFAEGRRHFPGARLVPVKMPKHGTDEWLATPFLRLGVLVLGSFRSYEDAVRTAKWFSSRSGLPYGSRAMIYDDKRGLIWPDDSEDQVWAGAYAPRRYDNECDMHAPRPCITVERSEAYEGFTPGLYIVVGGVLRRDQERAERLAAARKLVPQAYIKQTTIYLGCMH